ncbi:MAG: protein-L-isoaspartate(D-aspartate) O-methyltransferase [bacterium]|nr:protein-L-isoaspartate(D-aspartate) O-methyltransferase [bacterium]
MTDPLEDDRSEAGPDAEFRRAMVAQQIIGRGLRDPQVCGAMQRLPRHRFVPPEQRAAAYDDRALPIAGGQTVSQPYMVAYMTEALRLAEGMTVLEVGTGSGYQTALLALLGARVHTIERLKGLSEAAEALLGDLGLRSITYHVGDGSLGLPGNAPFDRILVTAGAPAIPRELVEQLAVNGRLVAPVGGPEQQNVIVVDRLPGRWIETPGLACRFVKLIGARGWRAGLE